MTPSSGGSVDATTVTPDDESRSFDVSFADVEPAAPHQDVKRRLAAAVDATRDEILELSHKIHGHPEPAFEEEQAARWIADALRRHGFDVDHPAGSLSTAIRATKAGGRSVDGP